MLFDIFHIYNRNFGVRGSAVGSVIVNVNASSMKPLKPWDLAVQW